MISSREREAAIFDAALQLPEPERLRYLHQACAGDAALRERIIALLLANDNTDSFLEPELTAIASSTISCDLPPSENVGDRIGRYKLLQQIGEGGCGVVYMAEQEEPVRRRVALKLIKLGMDTKQVIARFEAERQALALMDHPNIAKVLDAGATETGRPYFVMELVRGTKITEYCDHNNLTTAQRLDLFLQICRAVQHAHQKGIIHRDLKPSNILVTSADGVPLPKVIDFGIAKATQGRLTDKTVFTAFEQFLGTPAYMSPEQAEFNWLDVDTRSDIYSLGVLLYELLTGKTPFDSKELLASGLDAMRRTIREQEPERPSTRLSTMIAGDLSNTATHRQTEPPKLVHQVRGDLDWIVMKCLEKDRARRYETANGLAMDLQRHLNNEPVEARPPSSVYRFQKLMVRHKLTFAMAAAVLVSLLVGLGAATWMYFVERAAKREQVRLRQLAQSKEQIAQVNQKKAQTEAAKSAQVAQFLKEMLSSVGPSVSLGRDTRLLHEILDNTAERIGDGLRDQPVVEAELRNTLGNVYCQLDDYPKAEEMLRNSLNLRTSIFGETNALVADSLFDLGYVVSLRGRKNEAENIYRRCLAIRRTVFGNESFGVAYALGYLASVLERTNPEAAEATMREALEVGKKVSGTETTHYALGLLGLGGILISEGKLPEAEENFRECLKIRRTVLGNDAPEVAEALVALSQLLYAEGKTEQLEPIENEAIKRCERLASDDRPSLRSKVPVQALMDPLNAPRKLAQLLHQQGRLAEAELMSRRQIAMQRKIYGAEPSDAVAPLSNVLNSQGKLAEAEAVCREHLNHSLSVLPADDPKLAAAFWDLGNSLINQRKYADAAPIFRKSLEIRQKNFPDHWLTFHCQSILGYCFFEQKKYAQAEPLLVSAYQGLKQRAGIVPKERKYYLLTPLCWLAKLCNASGRTEEAAKWAKLLHHEQVELLTTNMRDNDPQDLNNFAWLLSTSPEGELRDGSKAIQLAERAVSLTSRTNSLYLDTLAAAYAEAGDFQEAIAVQKSAITLVLQADLKNDFGARLKLYEANTPYREP